MSESLIEDGDFNLENDYSIKRYNKYLEGTLDAHIPPPLSKEDTQIWYSLHNPGLPILLAPFLKLFGEKGATSLMLFLSTIALYLCYFWTFQITKNKTAGIIATIVFFSSGFFIAIKGYIFPNIISSILFLGAFLIMEQKKQKHASLFLLGVILGLGPWFHVKLFLSFATIGVIAVIQILVFSKTKTKDLLFLCLPSFFLIGLFEIKLFQWYGVLLPNNTFSGDIMFKVSILKSLPALFFDSTKGLLINNPAFFIIIFGIPLWIRKNPLQILKLAIIILPSFLLQSTFLSWWGGWAPSGRFFIDIIPLFMPAIGLAFLFLKTIWHKIIFYVFLTIHAFLSFIYIFSKNGWTWAGVRNPIFQTIENIFGISIDNFLPHFTPELRIVSGEKALFLLILFSIFLFIFGFYQSRRKNLNNNLLCILTEKKN
jgi:hypothetical protein